MLLAAFWIWTAAVVLGMGVSLFHLGLLPRRSWIVAAMHGIAAAIGLGVLPVALRGPMHGFAHGVESFGEIAALIAAGALVVGCAFLIFPRALARGWMIGAHATLGIAAYVFLAGYLLLG